MANRRTTPRLLQGKLDAEVRKAANDIYPDGYDMSLGELSSIYVKGEILIQPDYQRLFRWTQEQKSRFIESILIGIPVPPIFVFTDKSGKWELVDGLQRVSTICEFLGVLRDAEGKKVQPSVMNKTHLLPSFEGFTWDTGQLHLPESLRLKFRRARIRVEILKTGSSPRTRYELFQRLNTGGAALTAQEVRNCSVVMVNKSFFDWLQELVKYSPFKNAVSLTDNAIERQRPLELATKYLVINFISYRKTWDVNDYLDEGIISIALDKGFDRKKAQADFEEVFSLIDSQLGDAAFRRIKSGKPIGPFSDAAFEATVYGIFQNISRVRKQPSKLRSLVANLWEQDEFTKNAGAGVRGTLRLSRVLPFAKAHFALKK